ncbi:glutathione S-transferase family protein [Spirulina sp. CS-785/01]|uniref:glutathione S-transferase family protein n=1 Tax=Spirulina sp. CS-785/01 TaxID=3021716 RepID=UPI00232FDCCB|nr:glutathione S-transferase family protein [Spirulina sp. CS-785/01]MDB9312657.1 glutathione S-transferase family protein [Spirulina sp. CS-785/01]
MPQLELYSANVCPFAHRTRLTLLEKGVDFQLHEIDLSNKPDNFAEISPYEKVPVVKYGRDRIWESAIINEYIEELFPNPPLMPKTAGERALVRILIDFANSQFISAFYKILLFQNPEQQEKWKNKLHHHLEFLEHEGIGKLSQGGDYWFGEHLTLLDLTYYPWFERWCVLEHYREFPLPDSFPHLKQWWKTMQQRESVQTIANPPNLYIQDYQPYADGTAAGITAQEMRNN